MPATRQASFASTTKHHPRQTTLPARIPEYFGANVFNLQAMAKRLSEHDTDAVAKIMKFGGKITPDLADRLASAVCEWALDQGATHYCHWFQPQTGTTAEKHDAFLWFDKQGLPIERLKGQELLQSEPDASSFPSGGIRSTFEARGYTGWDPSSPMFIMESGHVKTLYIPSVFVGYHGEALDFKTPLLRSNEALSRIATKTLQLIGEKQSTHVYTFIGPEQEFFVVDKNLALSRLDLRLAGRTVFGRKPPKGQELEDHYFGNIPGRVQAFINELEITLYKLGIPVKTRHNEVAPGQFEIAPIYESANIAADHNQLVMTCLESIALRHDLVVLLHEKPFAGVNGSGKHINWSIGDSLGRNLLDPGSTPYENLVFLTFLCGILQGIHDNADVLRCSIATAGNDHRLGANEAPPAIISIFLGKTLDKILTTLEHGQDDYVSAEKVMINLGVAHLQAVAKDNTDRNRTSPFAFTGNKFEFRAVGSSAPISYPTAILNGAVCDGLDKINKQLEAKLKNGVLADSDLLAVLQQVIRQTKNIRFEGNGYSQEWREEAARRGLSNLANCPQAFAPLKSSEKTNFLIKNGILTEADIASRLAIQQERYIKQRLIEVNCAIEMARTLVLPVCFEYHTSLLKNIKLASETGALSPARKTAQELGEKINRAVGALTELAIEQEKLAGEDAMEHDHLAQTCATISEITMPKLEDLRLAIDSLEGLVPHRQWPYAKYSDLLFSPKSGG